MFGLGTWEIVLVLVLALLVLGPDKLPQVAKTIGRAMREMRRATNDLRMNMELDDLPPRVRPVPPEPAPPPAERDGTPRPAPPDPYVHDGELARAPDDPPPQSPASTTPPPTEDR